MSYGVLRWAYSVPIIAPGKVVLTTLAFHADEKGICRPSMRLMAAETGYAERTVRKGLRRLYDLGLVVASQHNYRLCIGAAIAEQPASPARMPRANRHVVPFELARGAADRHVVPSDLARGAKKPARGATHIENCHELPKRTAIELPARGIASLTLFGADAVRPVLVNGKLAAFEVWWREYPRKVAKGAAAVAYAKALTLTDAGTLLAALDRHWGDRKFIPHPTTWLNQQRWLDEGVIGDPVLRALGIGGDGIEQRDPIEEMAP